MATLTTHPQSGIDFRIGQRVREWAPAHTVTLAGRVLFSLIFIFSSFNHFKSATIGYAASQNVPFPEILVPFSGLMALIGGLSILLGYYTRIGALLVILFLIPVTLTMHAFWALPDGAQAEIQMAMFMKNISMLGGALMIFYFGAGPLSFDTARSDAGSA